MSSPYVLALARVIVGLAFAISFYRKTREFSEFGYSLEGFQIVPQALIRPFATLILIVELFLVGLLITGGDRLLIAFPLAILMLTVFSGAMLSVIIRKIENPCSCFGATDNLISGYDLLRNAGFIAWAAVGWYAVRESQTLPVLAWPVIGGAGLGFVLLWIRLRDVLHVAAHPGTALSHALKPHRSR